MRGKLIDQWVLTRATPGATVDLGWGIATINADRTVTRRCKGCGASVTSPYRVASGVLHTEPRALTHTAGCRVADAL